MKWILLICMLFSLHTASTQVVISGVISHKNKPLKKAKIRFQNDVVIIESKVDSLGRYEMKIPRTDGELIFSVGNKYWDEEWSIDSTNLNDTNEYSVDMDKKSFLKRLFKKRRRQVICGFCFVAGAQIAMANGTCKSIENINKNDLIYTFDDSIVESKISEVFHVDSVIHNNIIRVSFADGTILESTDDHPYWVEKKGWCSAKPDQTFKLYGIRCEKLELGDNCIKLNGDNLVVVTVTEIEKLDKEVMTYNISKISNGNSYFANGIVVSNESLRLVK